MSADLIAHLHDVASDFGALSARRMFGGHGVYHDGVMIGLISGDVLYLKVDDQTRERFRAADSGPFMYTRRGETVPTSYWSVPEAAMDSPQEMRPWLVLAYEAALRKATAARKVKPRKAGPIATGPAKARPVKALPATARSTKAGAGEPGRAKPKPTNAGIAKPKPAKTKPAKTNSAKSDSKRR